MTMTPTTHARRTSSTATRPSILGSVAAPATLLVTYLHAKSDLKKFRRQTPEQLRDAGITSEQAARMTVWDFMMQPRR